MERHTNVMIKKKSGHLKLELLHITMPFEAIFINKNKLIGWLGRHTRSNIEELSCSEAVQKQKGQGGQYLMSQQMVILQISQGLGFMFHGYQNCYNCIILIITALCLCRLGTMTKV